MSLVHDVSLALHEDRVTVVEVDPAVGQVVDVLHEARTQNGQEALKQSHPL